MLMLSRQVCLNTGFSPYIVKNRFVIFVMFKITICRIKNNRVYILHSSDHCYTVFISSSDGYKVSTNKLSMSFDR